MGYDYRSSSNRRSASALLRKHALPIDCPGTDIGDTPDRERLMVDFSPHWLASKVTGAHVYEAENGWNADLTFEGLPEGVPDIVGEGPFASRGAACASISLQLSICASRERDAIAAAEARAYFRFDECLVAVSPGLVERYAARAEQQGSTMEGIQAWLAELRYGISGEDALTDAHYRTCDLELRVEICKASTAAMALGMESFGLEDMVWEPEPSGLRH